MSSCLIGPILFDRGFYYEKNNDYGVMDGKEKFTIAGPIYKINQLRGLVTRGGTEESGGVTVRSTNQKDWGPIWVNAADVGDGTRDNVRMNHKGWYLLRNVDIDTINEYESKATLTLELINNSYDALLEMDYTISPNAGTPLKRGYDLTETLTLLEDDFLGASVDSTLWSSTVWNMTGGSHAVTGGKLALSGARTGITPGLPHWGARSIQSKATFNAPFYVEADLEIPTLAGGSNWDTTTHHIVIRPGQWVDSGDWPDTFLVISAASNVAREVRIATPSGHILVHSIGAGVTTTKWKALVEENGLISLWLWNTSTSEWDFFWKGPSGLSRTNMLNVGLTYHSHETTSRTVNTDKIKVYQTQDQVLRSIAKVPNTGRNTSTGIGTRGNTYIHQDGETDTTFQNHVSDPLQIFNGMPRVMSNYNPQSTYREVYSPLETLIPGRCYFYNDTFKLTPTLTGVQVHHNLSGEWALLNNFTFGTINYIKILNYTQEEIIVQINRTIWKLRRDEPFVYVKHPFTPLGFTRRTTCYHDGVLQNGLADGADVSMLSQFYSLIFTPHNLLNLNQWGLETDLSGWSATAATLSRVSPGHGGAGYAIQFDTNNSMAYEGIYQSSNAYSQLPSGNLSGLLVCVSAELKGSIGGETVKLQLNERDITGTSLASPLSPTLTLTTTFTNYAFITPLTNDLTTQLSMKVLTATQQDSIITGDYFDIQPTPSLNGIPWALNPNSPYRYGMYILKTHPTTIKTNSIPASDMTGIGVYDQMQPPLSPDSFNNLALEWLNPVNQRIRLVNGV